MAFENGIYTVPAGWDYATMKDLSGLRSLGELGSDADAIRVAESRTTDDQAQTRGAMPYCSYFNTTERVIKWLVPHDEAVAPDQSAQWSFQGINLNDRMRTDQEIANIASGLITAYDAQLTFGADRAEKIFGGVFENVKQILEGSDNVSIVQNGNKLTFDLTPAFVNNIDAKTFSGGKSFDTLVTQNQLMSALAGYDKVDADLGAITSLIDPAMDDMPAVAGKYVFTEAVDDPDAGNLLKNAVYLRDADGNYSLVKVPENGNSITVIDQENVYLYIEDEQAGVDGQWQPLPGRFTNSEVAALREVIGLYETWVSVDQMNTAITDAISPLVPTRIAYNPDGLYPVTTLSQRIQHVVSENGAIVAVHQFMPGAIGGKRWFSVN